MGLKKVASSVYWWWVRRKYQFLNFKNYSQDLNNRAQVEIEMFRCVEGKRPMPDKDQLRAWAIKLGTPHAYKVGRECRCARK